MLKFEPQISGVRSNCSANCATTTAPTQPFCGTSLPLASTRFESHFQATDCFPPSTTTDKPQQHRPFFHLEKFGDAGTLTLGNWVRKNCVLCCPSTPPPPFLPNIWLLSQFCLSQIHESITTRCMRVSFNSIVHQKNTALEIRRLLSFIIIKFILS